MKVARLDQNQFRALIAHRKHITRKGKHKRRFKKFKVPPVPTQSIIKYRTYLDAYFKKLKDLVDIKLIPKISGWVDEITKHHPTGSRKDAPTDDVKTILEQIQLELGVEFSDQEKEDVALMIARSVSAINKSNFLGNMKEVANIDLLLAEPYLDNALAMFAVQNADLISSVTDQLLDKVSNRIYDAFRNGDRAESIEQDIGSILDVSDSKASFIARDQIGKLNGQLDRLRQTEVGVSKYIWRGMDDERERESHRENNDQVFSWDDPPVETGHPGEDYNCRCYAEPVLEDVIDGQDQGEADDEG